jgi:hypothetical protein
VPEGDEREEGEQSADHGDGLGERVGRKYAAGVPAGEGSHVPE